MICRILRRGFCTKINDLTSVKEIYKKKPVGSERTIQGWASAVRKMGKVIFVDVSDGSFVTPLQVVFETGTLKERMEVGASFSVTGVLKCSPRGQLELHAKDVNVFGHFDREGYPFTKKENQTLDHYRRFLHIRPKIRYFKSMMRFRSAASHRINHYFNENGFTFIHTPILTSGDCEGAAETFLVKPSSEELIRTMKREDISSDDSAFFNKPAYLTVSGQLHLEALARSISKVYTFNPAFRAENSISRLHLSEFYMVEAEEAFIEDLEPLLRRIEDCIKQITSYLVSNYLDEIESMLPFNETDKSEHLKMLENVINKPFLVMSFTEAKDLINRNQSKFERSKLKPFNLTKAEEIFLVEQNNQVPVFVTNWPKNEKPFYMKQTNGNPDLVKGVDLLVPNVGELCGGSVREEDYNILEERLTEMKILDQMKWYLELRQFGNVPTAGFGMGFERFIQFLLNVQSIKDVIPFPRHPHHLKL